MSGTSVFSPSRKEENKFPKCQGEFLSADVCMRVHLCSGFDRGEGAVLDKIREKKEGRLLGWYSRKFGGWRRTDMSIPHTHGCDHHLMRIIKNKWYRLKGNFIDVPSDWLGGGTEAVNHVWTHPPWKCVLISSHVASVGLWEMINPHKKEISLQVQTQTLKLLQSLQTPWAWTKNWAHLRVYLFTLKGSGDYWSLPFGRPHKWDRRERKRSVLPFCYLPERSWRGCSPQFIWTLKQQTT